LELNALLSAWPSGPDILCFSEHLLLRDQILYLNIDQYKLADSFCRTNDKNGGSCIFVSKSIKTREVSSLKSLGRDKILEISAIEIVEFKIIVICIYRSPNSDEKTFLGLLEEAIIRVLNKGRLLVICGDCNINLLQKN
jgi:exonuclease III